MFAPKESMKSACFADNVGLFLEKRFLRRIGIPAYVIVKVLITALDYRRIPHCNWHSSRYISK